MSFIDTLYSNMFYLMVIFMVWIFGFVGLSFLNPFKNKTVNFLYKGLMYVLAGLIMILPMVFYYGLSSDFNTITIGRTTVCLKEQYERGSDGPGEQICRLTVLDKNTGERKERRYIGNAGKLLVQKGDTVVYFYNQDLVMMHAATLEEIYTMTKDDWAVKYPLLEEGVEYISDNQNSNQPKNLYITINGKNGNHYWFDPFTKELLSKEPEDQKIMGIYTTGYDLFEFVEGREYQQTVLGQESLNGSNRKKIKTGERYQHLFGPQQEESYIDPVFMMVDTAKKCFVFSHYRTTDKTAIWVEAKDFQFKTLWKKDSKQLDAADGYGTDKVSVYAYSEGLLYFNMGGFVICMEPLSGKQKWKVRL